MPTANRSSNELSDGGAAIKFGGAGSKPCVARRRRKWDVWGAVVVGYTFGSVWRRRRWIWRVGKLAMSSPWGWRWWLVFGSEVAIEDESWCRAT